MKLLILILASLGLQAQTQMSITGPATAYAGQSPQLTLSLAGSGSLNITGLEWGLSLPAGLTAGLPTAGAASTAATKSIGAGLCNAALTLCLALGYVPPQGNNPAVITNLPY